MSIINLLKLSRSISHIRLMRHCSNKCKHKHDDDICHLSSASTVFQQTSAVKSWALRYKI